MSAEAGLTNRSFLHVLESVEAVVGKRGMSAILRRVNLTQYLDHYPPANDQVGEHRPEYVTQITRGLYDIYGTHGSHAILADMGAAQAKIAIAENGMLASMTRLALKAMPKRNQIKLTLETIAKEMRTQMKRQITLSEEEQAFIYQDDTCLYCRDWRDQPSPVCFSVVGFLREMMAWATGDKTIQVEELVCRANGGDTCRFTISFK